METFFIRAKATVFLFFVCSSFGCAQQFDNGRFIVLLSQPEFAPGDTAFFTVFNATRELPKKFVLNLSVANSDALIVVNERVLSQNGLAHGQFVIPPNVSPDIHRLVLWAEEGWLAHNPKIDVAPLRIVGPHEWKTADAAYKENPFDTTIWKIALNKGTFKPREKVFGKVKIPERQKSTMMAITVFKSDLLNGSPLMKTKTVDQSKQERSGTRFPIPYFFVGRAFNKENSSPLADSCRITFYLSESAIIYSVYSKGDGYFSFPMFKNFQTENLFYSISQNGVPLSGYTIEIFTPQISLPVEQAEQTDKSDAYALYSQRKAAVDNAYHYTPLSGENNAEDELNEFESDHEVSLGNLGPFASMEELLANVVPMTKPRNGGIRIFLQKAAKYAGADPLYLINGIMTDDTDFVLKLDPGIIRSIAVLRSPKTLLRFGELGRNGILVIQTTTNVDPAIFEKNIFVRGFIEPISEKINDTSGNHRTPKLQPQLFWSTRRSITNELSFDFNTADDLGKYSVYVLTFHDENLFWMTSSFEVTR